MKKHNCYVLVYSHNGNTHPILSVLGVFKKKQQAEKYLKWLNPKDSEKYSINHSQTFDYEDNDTIKGGREMTYPKPLTKEEEEKLKAEQQAMEIFARLGGRTLGIKLEGETK